MSNESKQPDKRDITEDEQDVEGNSMLLYEQARVNAREREQQVQKSARDARLLEDSKTQKR